MDRWICVCVCEVQLEVLVFQISDLKSYTVRGAFVCILFLVKIYNTCSGQQQKKTEWPLPLTAINKDKWTAQLRRCPWVFNRNKNVAKLIFEFGHMRNEKQKCIEKSLQILIEGPDQKILLGMTPKKNETNKYTYYWWKQNCKIINRLERTRSHSLFCQCGGH